MGKLDKQYERKAQIAKTKKNFKTYLDRYTKQEQDLINLAAKCKKDGRTFDYKQTLATLKYISSQKRKMSKFLYQIELVEILQDEAQMGKDFVTLMGQVNSETAKVYKTIDPKKTKKIAENTRKIASQQNTFNDYLAQLSEMQEETADTNVELDKDILAQIDAIAGVTEINVDVAQTNEPTAQTNEMDDIEKEFLSF